MGPFRKSPGRVLLHLLMVGWLSQVMDKETVYVNVVNKNTEPVCAGEVKDNVGVLAVLAMHSGNVNKNIERMCAREVIRNVNVNNVVLAVLAMHSVNMNKNIERMCAREMMSNVNNVVLLVLARFNVNNMERVGDEINGYVNYVDGYVNNVDVNKEVLAVLAMLDMIREDDIVDTPRLDRTHQEEGEDGREVKKAKLDKVKTTDQTDSDGDIIWFVQETGDTLEKKKSQEGDWGCLRQRGHR
jgi:hypothetical protein